MVSAIKLLPAGNGLSVTVTFSVLAAVLGFNECCKRSAGSVENSPENLLTYLLYIQLCQFPVA